MKFKVLAGGHVQDDPCSPEPSERQRERGMVRASKTYMPGEVLENDLDLVKLFGPNKFERVPDNTPVSGSPSPHAHEPPIAPHKGLVVDDRERITDPRFPSVMGQKPPSSQTEYFGMLDKLTPAELKSLAASEEIDLKGVKTKEEMLKIIKAAT